MQRAVKTKISKYLKLKELVEKTQEEMAQLKEELSSSFDENKDWFNEDGKFEKDGFKVSIAYNPPAVLKDGRPITKNEKESLCNVIPKIYVQTTLNVSKASTEGADDKRLLSAFRKHGVQITKSSRYDIKAVKK